jgi:Tfp pilus assembly protein PilF
LANAVRGCALQSPSIEAIKKGGSDTPEAYYKQAIAWRDQGMLSEAVQDLEKCIKIDGRFGSCYCVLAGIKQSFMEKREVSRLCRKCLNYSSEEQIVPERELCSRLLE